MKNEVHFVYAFDADYEDCPIIACGWDDPCQCTLEDSKVTCKKCLNWIKKHQLVLNRLVGFSEKT